MKRAALILIFAVAACRTTSIVERENPYAHDRDAALAGAKLYREHCAACHGQSAEGRGNAPSLRTSRLVDSGDAAVFAFITNGDLRHGMPSWAQLTDERRWQIVSYLRSLHSTGSEDGTRVPASLPR